MDHERYRHMHGGSGSSMKKASFEVALKGKKQIAEGAWAFVFEKPVGFEFRAGQHVRMTLINPTETDNKGNSRFWSLASTPQDPDLVFAMRMGQSAFKRTLKDMNIGEKVLLQVLLDVPHGAFALHDDSAIPAVFLIGGIGIVPAYSMIKDALQRKLKHQLFLFYSNRRPEDAPFLAELKQLATEHANFKLIATMTEPEKSSQSWQGENGFINEALLKKYVSDPQSPIYYIAGLPEMTSAMKAMLTNLGIGEDKIHAEEFTGFNLNELRGDTNYAWKKHALLGVVVVMVLAFIILHVFAVNSLQSVISLKSPLAYLMIAVMLMVVPFKLKHILALKHLKKK